MDAANPSHARKRTVLKRPPRRVGTEVHWISLSAREDLPPFAILRKGSSTPTALGKALAASWRELGRKHASVVPDLLALGPRSLEGILFISHRGEENLSLAEAVKLLKVIAARRLAASMGSSRGAEQLSEGPWKKGYAERTISGAKELASARRALKAKSA